LRSATQVLCHRGRRSASRIVCKKGTRGYAIQSVMAIEPQDALQRPATALAADDSNMPDSRRAPAVGGLTGFTCSAHFGSSDLRDIAVRFRTSGDTSFLHPVKTNSGNSTQPNQGFSHCRQQHQATNSFHPASADAMKNRGSTRRFALNGPLAEASTSKARKTKTSPWEVKGASLIQCMNLFDDDIATPRGRAAADQLD